MTLKKRNRDVLAVVVLVIERNGLGDLEAGKRDLHPGTPGVCDREVLDGGCDVSIHGFIGVVVAPGIEPGAG